MKRFVLYTRALVYGVCAFPADLSLLLHPIYPPGPVITNHFSSDSICQTLYRPGMMRPVDLQAHISIGTFYQVQIIPTSSEIGVFFMFICYDLRSSLAESYLLYPRPHVDRVGPFLMRCPPATELKVVEFQGSNWTGNNYWSHGPRS